MKVWLILLFVIAEVFGGVVDMIQNEHKLRIGIKYDTKPFGFKEGKKIKGFDLELSKLIVQELKNRYNISELHLFYKKVLPKNREQMLLTKKVDMVVATYTITDKRKEKVDFSIPYFKDKVIVVSHKPKTQQPKIGVLKGSTTEKYLKESGYSVELFEDYDKLFKAFFHNDIDAISSNKTILKEFINSNEVIIWDINHSENYGIGLPKGDKEFKMVIDEILDELKKNGKYEDLYKKWF